MRPVLVRDLALEHWASMDRYAEMIAHRVPGVLVADGWQLSGPRFLTRYWTYPRVLRRQTRQPGDVVHILDHSYAHCLRAFPGVPSVITCHDLYPLRVLAESRRTLRGVVRDSLLRWVLHWIERTDRLIVSTAFTAREAERFLNVKPERIRVIPYGVGAHFFVKPADAAIAERRRAWVGPRSASWVLLHVGSCDARKNVEVAITALGILRQGGLDAMLVQVGGSFRASHHDAIAKAGVQDHVVQESSVSEADLVSAYHAADLLVMPSTFEGYGLPVVEAQAAGLPVVTSGAGGLREATGDAGIVTGTVDASPTAEAIGDLLLEPERRAELAARGRARAAGLTWDRTAERTLAVYAELAGS